MTAFDHTWPPHCKTPGQGPGSLWREDAWGSPARESYPELTTRTRPDKSRLFHRPWARHLGKSVSRKVKQGRGLFQKDTEETRLRKPLAAPGRSPGPGMQASSRGIAGKAGAAAPWAGDQMPQHTFTSRGRELCDRMSCLPGAAPELLRGRVGTPAASGDRCRDTRVDVWRDRKQMCGSADSWRTCRRPLVGTGRIPVNPLHAEDVAG